MHGMGEHAGFYMDCPECMHRFEVAHPHRFKLRGPYSATDHDPAVFWGALRDDPEVAEAMEEARRALGRLNEASRELLARLDSQASTPRSGEPRAYDVDSDDDIYAGPANAG